MHAGGEIRNRMRGGGGDNVGGNTIPRATARRQTTNLTGAVGGEHDPQEAAAQGAVDEVPQPDRTPAVVRQFRCDCRRVLLSIGACVARTKPYFPEAVPWLGGLAGAAPSQ